MRFGPILLALVTIAMPVASAQTEGAEEFVTQVHDFAYDTLSNVNAVIDGIAGTGLTLPVLNEGSSSEETSEETREAPPAEHAHGHEPAPPAEKQAPRQETLLGSATRLVPVPVTLPGPAPRIDLDAIERLASEIAPRSPAEAPTDAQTFSTPVAPASAPATTTAPEAAADASLVALGVAAAGTAAAPVAFSLWDRVRRFGWLAILYTRIAKERLLDHGSRERLLVAIRARPGIAVADLAEASASPRNTITYHLRVLEREGLVSSTKNGRNRLFFAPGSLPPRAAVDVNGPATSPSRQQVVAAIATLRHETTFAVAKAVGANPGVDQKSLCTALGLSPSLAHWHADRLVASGLVDKRREGRSVRYYPGASYDVVTARSA